MDNKDIIIEFYTSFAKADAEGMVRCYAPDITFKDPAFGELKGEDAKNLWRMLIDRSKGGLTVQYNNVMADDKTGSADWVATYIFTQTGRKVVNRVSAKFEFKNGKIIRHLDYFDMWEWCGQALGWKGYLLGWTKFMKAKIQKQTHHLLKKYKQEN